MELSRLGDMVGQVLPMLNVPPDTEATRDEIRAVARELMALSGYGIVGEIEVMHFPNMTELDKIMAGVDPSTADVWGWKATVERA
jgi:hypothetical protein